MDGRCDANHCDSPNVEPIRVEIHDDHGARIHFRALEFCPSHLQTFVAASTQLENDLDAVAATLDPGVLT